MNRQEFNDKAEQLTDDALEKIKSNSRSWIIILVLGVLLVAIVKFWL